MMNYHKYSASVLAIMISFAGAHAQAPERQGGEGPAQKEGPVQKGEPKGPAQGNKNEKATGGQAQGEPKREAPNQQRAQNQPEKPGANREQPSKEPAKPGTSTAQGNEHKPEPGKAGSKESAGRETANSPSQTQERDRSATPQNRDKAKINVTNEQKTRVRDVIKTDNSIRRVNRSEINFNLNVGTRIPETVVYYDAPPSLIGVIPDVQRYKVIVLDDVILVVDPETREIIDVIDI